MARRKSVGAAPALDLDAVARRIGHAFAAPDLLRRALMHSSGVQSAGQSNERLEFLGDRVLGLLIAEWLIERFPDEREGDLGKRLSSLVAAETLARIAETLGLHESLQVPPSYGASGIRIWGNVLADAVEAVLGAIYLDAGLPGARAFVRREWQAALEADRRPPMSAKSRLQEWLAGRGMAAPEYRLVSAEGPPHNPVFVVIVGAGGRDAEGVGETKRAAEQVAAEAWMQGIAKPRLTQP